MNMFPRIVLLVFAALVAFAAAPLFLQSQETLQSNGATKDVKSEFYAFTNARIIISPTTTIERGTLLVRKGVIEAVGATVNIPPEAVVFDMKGKWLYPSFIDLDSDYGMPALPPPAAPAAEPQQQQLRRPLPQYETQTKGAFAWNEALKPEKTAHTLFVANAKTADDLRKLGFGAVQTFVHDGIARGTSTVVSLGDGKENLLVLKDRSAAQYSLNKGTSQQLYPSSSMGVIALLRQTYLDADWYKKARAAEPLRTEYNISLEAWNDAQSLPQIMDVSGGKINIFRAAKVGDEFGVKYVLRTAGDEYQYIEDVKKANPAGVIAPLNFPLAYNLDDPLDAVNITLAAMRHWERAPTNPAALEKAGIPFAFTTAGLRNKADYMENIRTALKHGLSKQKALEALTLAPAQILRLADKIGSLEKGKTANFLVCSGDIFDKETVIYQNWVQGTVYELMSTAVADIRGTYKLMLENVGEYALTVKGTVAAPQTELTKASDTLKISATLDRAANLITLRFARANTNDPKTKTPPPPELLLSGWIDTKTNAETWSGKGQTETGTWFTWRAERTKAFEPPPAKPDTTNPLADIGERVFPAADVGFSATMLPKQETVLIKNATLWTNEKEGVLSNADILLKNGKIAAVGKTLNEAGARVIDGTGKHVTPGIIDEHSHIALQNINDGSQSVVCEVRMSDAINPEDVSIYRQLAGGVTTAQLLHGSANTIDGQSALIKLRWGRLADGLLFENAPPFVKFALGENVKQANWGELFTTRFPQTRMGVEQVIVDAFTRAREYEALVKKSSGGAAPVRRDLELEALVEIVSGKRFITCHSYVQSEITMLMRVTEQFGFKVNTFTHILEGYKVADKLKQHGAHASSFSDWWSYKYEVADAIPYNGAILHAMGVNVAYNSDDPEMARRLNQEAAKAVKYGGVPEAEALKFVTLNPAIMLHIENRTGSLKVGKDADVVVWSDNPLSIYARAEKTFVDGIAYYDRERDAELRESIRSERSRLTQKMIRAKRAGAPTQAVPAAPRGSRLHLKCDTLGDVFSEMGE